MWDLTVPGNNDHDFYVTASAAAYGTPVLVHNNSCSLSEVYATLSGQSYNEKTVGQLVQRNPDGSVSPKGDPMISGNSDMTGEIRAFLKSLGLSPAQRYAAAQHPDSELIWGIRDQIKSGVSVPKNLEMVITKDDGPCWSCNESLPYLLPRGYNLTIHYPGGPDGSMISTEPIIGIGPPA